VDAQNIAHYRIVRLLGTGGMGEVFLAEDTELERSVALKVMSAELAKDVSQRKRFRAEAKAASGLAHPNVCVIHDVGETEDGRPFLAMEYVQGQTLDKILQQRRLSLKEAIKLGVEVAEALDAAHALRIVHRDIKPANIMIDRRGVAKVLDFGLAKRFSEDELAAPTSSVPQTKTGMLIGTPQYMSPEQALGRELDARTDLFSLGVVLYEGITGQRPFLGKTVGEIINNIINQRPEPLGVQDPLVASALEQIIAHCLQKAPGDRYGSARQLADELGKVKHQLELAHHAQEKPTTVPGAGAATTGPAPPSPALTQTKRKVTPLQLGTVFVLLLLALALFGLAHHVKSSSGSNLATKNGRPSDTQNSVAVLPFDNFSSEADTEYLSDGLTEEITTALSRLPGLKVVARNSAFAFKGKKEDARKIGAALQVTKLLEGSIQKNGKRIHVNAELINVVDGFRLWSETYDRSIDDVLQVQEEIARRIADRLQGGTALSLQAHKAIKPEAYKYYLQGRAAWNKRTDPSLHKAVELFQSAIKTQPDYAEAYAALAATYFVLPEYSSSATLKECTPLARAAAERALDLDPACAESHAVLGGLQAAPPAHDFRGAEEHFRRAMQLDPNYATAHHWYGRYLVIHGQFDKARAEFEKAVELDPLSPSIRSTIANWYYLKGDFDRCIEESRKVIDAFPDFPPVHVALVMSCFLKGDYEQALKEVDSLRALQAQDPLFCLELRGYALARLGRTNEAHQIVAQLEPLCSQGKPIEGAIGFVYLGLRDYDHAVDLFQKAIDRDGIPEEFLCDPFLNEVRGLPKFQALLKRAGIEQNEFR